MCCPQTNQSTLIEFWVSLMLKWWYKCRTTYWSHNTNIILHYNSPLKSRQISSKHKTAKHNTALYTKITLQSNTNIRLHYFRHNTPHPITSVLSSYITSHKTAPNNITSLHSLAQHNYHIASMIFKVMALRYYPVQIITE